jgi:hypothetical protein
MVDFAAVFMLKIILSIISQCCNQGGGRVVDAVDLGLDDQGPGDVYAVGLTVLFQSEAY